MNLQIASWLSHLHSRNTAEFWSEVGKKPTGIVAPKYESTKTTEKKRDRLHISGSIVVFCKYIDIKLVSFGNDLLF